MALLSPAHAAHRRDRITASDAREIMNATTDAELLHWYQVKVCEIDPDPENYAMRLGTAAEPVIINERELETHETITRRQEVVDHPTHKGFCCTLDGWESSRRAVVEVKFVSAFMSREDIFRLYYPQVAFQMSCTDAAEGMLLVGQGTNPPIEIECVRDADYEGELLSRCAAALMCIKTLTPPCALPVVIPPERWRTVDLDVDRPNWAEELMAILATYESLKPYAEQYEAAGKEARALIPDDIGKVLAPGFMINRNKRGTLSILRRAA
ncbi:YqaJ viral recombinase family protein [Bradyrhizobium japonicum]|uniref:YqaJ viral recombinase family protein n=1 Tax=Bradyrhizobium japonicum TaxID=375 RepID=UPI002714F8D1|nr:YqaJ viral recombinase family protein [Bradyrhizobium japonicum]WLB24930.1 YqaJ viral recombinase family protein [Bradyrhizobium japonicum]